MKLAKALVAVAVGGLLFAATAWGEKPEAGDGNQLLRKCTFAMKVIEEGEQVRLSEAEQVEAFWCVGYAYGAISFLVAKGLPESQRMGGVLHAGTGPYEWPGNSRDSQGI